MNRYLRIMLFTAGIAACNVFPASSAPWQPMNSGVAREAPECVSTSALRVVCLARTFGNGASLSALENGRAELPKNLGNDLAASPSCVNRGSNGIDCFATVSNGALATISLTGGKWSNWTSLGGSLAPTRVSCLANGSKNLSCYARGANGELLKRTWAGGRVWDRWVTLGGLLSSDVACIAATVAQDACFGRGIKGELVAWSSSATGGSAHWIKLGGGVEGKPSCNVLGSGDIVCVSRDPSNSLVQWRGKAPYADGVGTFTKVEATATAEPSCFAMGETLHCGWRNGKGELVTAQIESDGRVSNAAVGTGGRIAGVKCLAISSESYACIVAASDKSLQYVGPVSVPPLAHATALPRKKAATSAGRSPDMHENLDGAWYLTDLASGFKCRVDMHSGASSKLNALKMTPQCGSLGISSAFTGWQRDLGSLRFSDSTSGLSLHFTPISAGRWLSPRQSSALMLSRLPAAKAKTA